MKKITSSILALLLCASMLASCSKVVEQPQNGSESVTSGITDVTEDKATESETVKKETEEEENKELRSPSRLVPNRPDLSLKIRLN